MGWGQPRWQGIKRPYTPEDVVSKAGYIASDLPKQRIKRESCGVCYRRRGRKGNQCIPVSSTMAAGGSCALLRYGGGGGGGKTG